MERTGLSTWIFSLLLITALILTAAPVCFADGDGTLSADPSMVEPGRWQLCSEGIFFPETYTFRHFSDGKAESFAEAPDLQGRKASAVFLLNQKLYYLLPLEDEGLVGFDVYTAKLDGSDAQNIFALALPFMQETPRIEDLKVADGMIYLSLSGQMVPEQENQKSYAAEVLLAVDPADGSTHFIDEPLRDNGRYRVIAAEKGRMYYLKTTADLPLSLEDYGKLPADDPVKQARPTADLFYRAYSKGALCVYNFETSKSSELFTSDGLTSVFQTPKKNQLFLLDNRALIRFDLESENYATLTDVQSNLIMIAAQDGWTLFHELGSDKEGQVVTSFLAYSEEAKGFVSQNAFVPYAAFGSTIIGHRTADKPDELSCLSWRDFKTGQFDKAERLEP